MEGECRESGKELTVLYRKFPEGQFGSTSFSFFLFLTDQCCWGPKPLLPKKYTEEEEEEEVGVSYCGRLSVTRDSENPRHRCLGSFSCTRKGGCFDFSRRRFVIFLGGKFPKAMRANKKIEKRRWGPGGYSFSADSPTCNLGLKARVAFG